MSAWHVYQGRFLKSLTRTPVSNIERILIATVMLMLLISIADSFHGYGVDNKNELRIAKLQAQQELVARRVHP